MLQQLIVMSTLKKHSFHYTKECSYIYIISKREKVFEMKSYIVVGSGILGASTAYHLAKTGANVTIVDRQQLGKQLMQEQELYVHGYHSVVIKHGIKLLKAVHVTILR